MFEIKKLKFTVVGAGKSGIACAKLIQKFGGSVFVTEYNTLSQHTETLLTQAHIPFEHQGHNTQKILTSTDVLVVSPGIPLNTPLVLEAKLHGIFVASEVEVASWFFPAHFVCLGITGTNGKSTTTNYLASLLGLNQHALACGNIGTSVSEVVLDYVSTPAQQDASAPFYLCIELSSYQLESTHSLVLQAGCFLNLQNDHLARYESLDEYLKAKWRMVLMIKKEGLVVLEKEVLAHALKLGLSLPCCEIKLIETVESLPSPLEKNTQKILFIENKIEQGRAFPVALYKELKKLPLEKIVNSTQLESMHLEYNASTNGARVSNHKAAVVWDIDTACLPGVHNIFNLVCASLIAKHLGISEHLINAQAEKATSLYTQLPHRLECLGAPAQKYIDSLHLQKQVEIYNDSKATNMESTLVALRSFTKPLHLLLGGQAKGDSYLPVLKFLGNPVVKVYAFGEAGPVICHALQSASEFVAGPFTTLIQAAEVALTQSKDGEIILLSPACSSFDEFKNFEHRGTVFRAWAASHFEENNHE